MNPGHSLECLSCGKTLVNPYESSKSTESRSESNIDGRSGASYLKPPSSYLAFAIFNTLCCCAPLGIVAIVFAALVNRKWQAGDYRGARNYSWRAKTWCWLSFGLGLAYGIIQWYRLLTFEGL
jgi:hypothetical protein